MAGLPRPTLVAPSRKSSVRQPLRQPLSRAQSVQPGLRSGAISPAESTVSTATSGGTKRKERDFEHDAQETNINVVVRCRGRNEREVRENSGVVLATEGVRGTSLELSMGPSALSNKTYHFDKVFSSAADQNMVYDDVVTPLLDEMLAGFNCTIFAYGQTGTGKTYTMSGDMNDHLGMLSDAAGIIPRALNSLFAKLESAEMECSVKCSFIELYNEELRDLISPDDNVKLKIYDDNSKKGHSSTLVQGMEESHIKSASQGIKLLQHGSHKRQVAATKCNDLSSRSHTVFTVTAYIKRTGDNGEDYVSAGKLNLVDLAGSENIQRSGAENKRAAEAGLINKSLLTLGRVINALVDKGSHIPYRESKLTRLLQDSLGGRTKTCIIATVSPAKSNLEETISTLDYAFRAKNIRNKPQVNQMVNKKTLLKEFTFEIERLKSELIATRQRNGVYLTNENYEEITVESESRRILSEEQAARIETMETNLRNKVQELYSLTSNFMALKRENDSTQILLDETKDVLDQTELVLSNTRQTLAEETVLRKAHQETEQQLAVVGSNLISTIGKVAKDVDGLHDKNRRKSDLQSLNRNTWGISKAQVSEVTSLVETRVEEFKTQQEILLDSIGVKMHSFVQDELEKLDSTRTFLQTNVATFEKSEAEVKEQTNAAKDEMDSVLEEIKTLREEVKTRVGEGLQGLSLAAQRISAEVISELSVFHTQLHGSYSSLGRDFKSLFEDLLRHINAQKSESERLRQQLYIAHDLVAQANQAASSRMGEILQEEREQNAVDRQTLLSQIANLVNAQGQTQDARLSGKIELVQNNIKASKESFESSTAQYENGMISWSASEDKLLEEVVRSRETLKSKLKEDWMAANKHNASLQLCTKSVHEETIRIVDAQMSNMATQMKALDDFVTRAQGQNATHHDQHTGSLRNLSSTVKSSFDNIGMHFTSTYDRVRELGEDMSAKTTTFHNALAPLDEHLCEPLAGLRNNIENTDLQEYQATGETPQKTQYTYPTDLPRTEAHDNLLAAMRANIMSEEQLSSPSKVPVMVPVIFNDDNLEEDDTLPLASFRSSRSSRATSDSEKRRNTSAGLREVDVNTMNMSTMSVPALISDDGSLSQVPNFRKSVKGEGKLPVVKATKKSMVSFEGRENSVNLSGSLLAQQSTGRRRSPRTA